MSVEDWNLSGWAPSGVDPERKTVTLTASREDLHLDERADGWTVSVATRGHGTGAIVAPTSVAFNLIVSTRWPHPLHVAGHGASVKLTATGTTSQLELDAPVCEVHVEGPAKITGEHSYRLIVQNGGPRTVVRGTAPVHELVGSGPLQLDSPLVGGPTQQLLKGFRGPLVLAQPVADVDLLGPDVELRAMQAMHDCTVDVATLRAEGHLSKCRVTARTFVRAIGLEDSSVDVTAGEDRPVVIVASGPDRASPAEPLSAKNLNEIWTWAAQPSSVIRSRITCSVGDVVVGKAVDSTIEIGGTVQCDSVEAGPEASDVVISAGRHVGVRGAVTLADGRAIRAGGRTEISGLLSGGLVDAEVVDVESVSGAAIMAATTCSVRKTATRGSIAAHVIHLGGPVDHVDVTAAGTLSVRGNVTASKLKSAGDVEWNAPASADSGTTLELCGAAVLPPSYYGHLVWTPTNDHVAVTIEGSPASVVAKSKPSNVLTLAAIEDACSTVRVSGHLTLHVEKAKGTRTWETEHLDLETADTRIDINAVDGVQIQKVTAAPGATVRNDQPSSSVSILLGACDGLRLAGPGMFTVTGWSEEEAAKRGLIAECGSISLDAGEVGTLEARFDGKAPTLNVAADAIVHVLLGDVALGQVRGRVAGPDRRWRLGSSTPPAAPRVRDIAAQEDDAQTGIVTGVDLSVARYGALLNADGFFVFEPDPKALMEWAKKSDGPNHERRTAAAQAQRIAEQVKTTAASGSARSAAMWSAARTHASAVPKLSGERALRLIHRALGYSQRPLPPLLTYLAAVTACALASWAFDLVHRDYRPDNYGDGARLLLRIALHPASFALGRVPQTGEVAPLFPEPWWSMLAFLGTGVPLVFMLVALKNFMQSPAAGKT